MNRRSFLLGLLSTTAAPAIARAMPVHAYVPEYTIRTGLPMPAWRRLNQGIAATIYYGNEDLTPVKFSGFHMNVPCFATDETWELEDE